MLLFGKRRGAVCVLRPPAVGFNQGSPGLSCLQQKGALCQDRVLLLPVWTPTAAQVTWTPDYTTMKILQLSLQFLPLVCEKES